MDRKLFRTCYVLAAAAAPFLLCAAAPDAGSRGMHVEISDLGPLAQAQPASAKTLTFQNAIYQAAPVPNQDVEAPHGVIRQEAQLSPKLLSAKLPYQGDGYSFGSSQETAIDNRKAAAAGLGLSVPVN